MTTAALSRLVSLCPPPPRPQHARGDRATACVAAGWAIPDHVFEVVETYGDVTWMDWLLAPSPFSASGLEALVNRADDVIPLSGGAPSLLAFSDPEGAMVFIGEDGLVSVSSEDRVVATGRPLADMLLAWLQGKELFGLLPPAELSNAPDIPPFAIPFFDDGRESRITWAFVRGGAPSRAARWEVLLAALGPHVRCSVTGEGERRQDKVHIPALELNVIYDSYNASGGIEQLHLHHYADRAGDVKATVMTALAAAGMELVRVEGPRGAKEW